jgi:hypothetical protein
MDQYDGLASPMQLVLELETVDAGPLHERNGLVMSGMNRLVQ